jgi:hypothetical protein
MISGGAEVVERERVLRERKQSQQKQEWADSWDQRVDVNEKLRFAIDFGLLRTAQNGYSTVSSGDGSIPCPAAGERGATEDGSRASQLVQDRSRLALKT